MASKAQKFIYTMQAEYQGKSEMSELSGDLQKIGQIDSFQKLQTDFASTTTALTGATARMHELKSEMNNSFDPKLQARIGQTNEKITKLSRTYTKQQTRLGILSDKLRIATEAHKKFGSSLSGEHTEEQAGQLQELALAVEKSDIAYRQHQLTIANTTDRLTDAKREVKGLREAFADSVDPALRRQYSATKDEVQKLSTELRAQKTALTGSRQSMQEQGFAMGDLAGEYQKLDARTTAHGKKIAAMKTLGVQSFASIEQKTKSLHEAYKVLEKDPSITAKELRVAKQKMEADLASLTGKTGGFASKVDKVKAGFVGLAGLAAGGYVFKNMVQQSGDAAKELENFARVAGTSVEQFSATAYAVESVGISQEKLADMSKDVKDKIGDFIETGGGEFKDFFENVAPLVGVTADELIRMSGPDALVAVKKAMDDANISAESQVFYLESIANDASLLTPLLAENGKALKEKADRARELGIAISDMDNAKLVEMAQVNKDLAKTMGALSREIVSAVAPAIQVLAGHAQRAVAWFNQLSPGLQKFIVYAGAGTAAVTALGMVFAPFISTITLGAPLIASIGIGLGALASSAKLATISSHLLGVAMKGIPLIGIALAVYEIGKAFGIWTPILHTVQKGAISLAAGIHLLGLKIRWLWNVLTGDDAEVAAIEKRMEEVDTMYGKMFAGIGKKQIEQIESSKNSQKNITEEVEKGALAQLTVAQETAKKMAEAYSAVDGVSDKKGKGKEKVDEFGVTKSERDSMDSELAKLDAVRNSKNGKGYNKKYNDDGTWDVVLNKKSASLADNIQGKVDALPQLESQKSSSDSSGEKPASRTVEIKFPSGSLYGDEDATEKVIADLQRMGAMA